MTIFDIMLEEQRALLREVNNINIRLDKLPEGKLLCAKNDNRAKWYVSDGKEKTYISKKEKFYASQLAERKYLESKLEDCNRKLYAITMFIRHYNPAHDKCDALLNNPLYRELLDSKYQTWEDTISEWLNTKYETNPEHPEHLLIQAKTGIKVRSKSEAMIVSELYQSKIPFHYEEKLVLENNTVFYPDFTIMHPRNGKIYYWEHLGLMDDDDYRTKAFEKLKVYALNGIIPNINLILTTETTAHPLDPGKIKQTIEMYLQ